MIDKQPTQEQIKEVWEWCGFKWNSRKDLWDDPIHGLISSQLPKLDLNNLFKYAVPKLRELKYYIVLRDISKGFHCSLVYTTIEKRSWYGENNDPALALFWAIWRGI